MANSNAARAMPTAIAATPGRVRSRVIIASLKPLFSSPSRFSAGTSTSLKEIVAVLEARCPSLSSFLSTDDAAESRSTTNARDAAVAGVLVGLGVDRVVVGVAAVGDEALGAVDDVLVALLHGGGAHAGDVGAGVGLGQAEGGELGRLGRACRGTSSWSPRSRRARSARSRGRCSRARCRCPSSPRRAPPRSGSRRGSRGAGSAVLLGDVACSSGRPPRPS